MTRCCPSWFLHSLLALAAVVGLGFLAACQGEDRVPWQEPTRDCARLHLEEAIALNQERLPRYAALTQERSRPVSEALIGLEEGLLVVADYLDSWSLPYQKKGIPLMCAEFVSMHEVPAFSERFSFPPHLLSDFVAEDHQALRDRLDAAFDDSGFQGLSQAASLELVRLEAWPGFHCMLRHLLESLVRAANLAPGHVEQALALGLASPEDISKNLILALLVGLEDGALLDAQAAPLQAEGLPIICQDVPEIPAWP